MSVAHSPPGKVYAFEKGRIFFARFAIAFRVARRDASAERGGRGAPCFVTMVGRLITDVFEMLELRAISDDMLDPPSTPHE